MSTRDQKDLARVQAVIDAYRQHPGPNPEPPAALDQLILRAAGKTHANTAARAHSENVIPLSKRLRPLALAAGIAGVGFSAFLYQQNRQAEVSAPYAKAAQVSEAGPTESAPELREAGAGAGQTQLPDAMAKPMADAVTYAAANGGGDAMATSSATSATAPAIAAAPAAIATAPELMLRRAPAQPTDSRYRAQSAVANAPAVAEAPAVNIEAQDKAEDLLTSFPPTPVSAKANASMSAMGAPESFPADTEADGAAPAAEPAAEPIAQPALAAPTPPPYTIANDAAPSATQAAKAENTSKEAVDFDARARREAMPEGKLQTQSVENTYRDIRALLKAGKRKQARQALHALTQAQPNLALPADLQALAKER
jgi:hypothetical protein